MIVIRADPERHRARRIIHEHRAHVGVARHQILHGRIGLRIEPHHAVRAHGRSPDLAVLVEIGAIGEGVWRERIFGELGIEQRRLAGAIFGHQHAILGVDFHAAGTGVRRRRGVPGHGAGLGVDLAEMAFGDASTVTGIASTRASADMPRR